MFKIIKQTLKADPLWALLIALKLIRIKLLISVREVDLPN